jgi:hypothetical protein
MPHVIGKLRRIVVPGSCFQNRYNAAYQILRRLEELLLRDRNRTILMKRQIFLLNWPATFDARIDWRRNFENGIASK